MMKWKELFIVTISKAFRLSQHCTMTGKSTFLDMPVVPVTHKSHISHLSVFLVLVIER